MRSPDFNNTSPESGNKRKEEADDFLYFATEDLEYFLDFDEGDMPENVPEPMPEDTDESNLGTAGLPLIVDRQGDLIAVDMLIGKASERWKFDNLVDLGLVFASFDNYEDKKSEEDLKLIADCNRETDDLRSKYGKLGGVDISAENIAFITKNLTEFRREYKFGAGGKCYSRFQKIAVIPYFQKKGEYKPGSMNKFSLTHEMIHFKGFNAISITKDYDLYERQAGLSLARDKKDEKGNKIKYRAFVNLCEGMVDSLAAETMRNERGDFAISYPLQQDLLEKLIRKIFESSFPGDFESPQEVYSMFAKAHFDGKLGRISRVVNKLFGPGTFLKMAQLDCSTDYEDVKKLGNFIEDLEPIKGI
jgi:hypothetical protein